MECECGNKVLLLLLKCPHCGRSLTENLKKVKHILIYILGLIFIITVDIVLFKTGFLRMYISFVQNAHKTIPADSFTALEAVFYLLCHIVLFIFLWLLPFGILVGLPLHYIRTLINYSFTFIFKIIFYDPLKALLHPPRKCMHSFKKDCWCNKCGELHNAQHNWEGCTCKICGKQRDEQHNWDGCICKVCGKKRDIQHEWDGCKCKRCGKSGNHEWEAKEVEVEYSEDCDYSSLGTVTHTWTKTEIEYRCKRCGALKI
jgi:hypothetical protein